MVLKRLIRSIGLVAGLAALALAAPAAAHKGDSHGTEQSAPTGAAVEHPMSQRVHEAVKDDLARLEAEASRPWHQRLLDWIGRLHPFAVHFPIALFPVAWVALILGRRRGDSQPLVRAIVVVAGASAVLAAGLGWLDAGFLLADADPVLLWHRWIGTGLGVAGAAAAILAWRRPAAARSAVLTWSLGAVTAVLMVQGWLGGALVHGIDHLAW